MRLWARVSELADKLKTDDQKRIEQFLRITVGTDEQCTTLINALRTVLR